MRITTCVIGLFLLTALLGPIDQTELAATKVIIDTDIGHCGDDSFALALALQSPELNIIGITIENAFKDGEKVALKLAHLAGRDDIPVVANGTFVPGVKEGIVPPGLEPRPNTEPPVGSTGVWAKDYNTTKVNDESAVDFIISKVRESPGEIVLITLGPLTNIREAFVKAPDIKDDIKEIIMMAGSIYRGYFTTYPVPEWNIECDIEAAREVFSSNVPITMVGLDATSDFKLRKEDSDRIRESHALLAEPLWELYSLRSIIWELDTITLHDVLAVMVAIDDTFVETRPMRLEIDDEGYTRVNGALPPNADVCLSADYYRCLDFVMDRILS